ncbi:MAG: type II toxin-antitoxin system VapC family toxin [Acidimicrobiales bacterium]
MIVVDASVVAPALADDDDDGARARARLQRERIVAPQLLDVEVLSVIRKGRLAGLLDERRAAMAVLDLARLRVDRVAHRPLLARAWELRLNLTAYDAMYVALAESLDVKLVTSDERLLRAPGRRCDIELLERSTP